MPKWAILVMGLIVLALGIVLVVEGSQWIVGVVVLVVSVPVVFLGITKMGIKRKPKQETPPTLSATETQNKPPAT